MQTGQEGGVARKSERVQRVSYSRQWSAYARRRNLALIFLFGAVPFAAAAYWFTQYRLGQPLLGLVALIIWCGLLAFAVWWAGEFRCPRCLRRIGALGSQTGPATLWRGLFDKVCPNCKLRRWE